MFKYITQDLKVIQPFSFLFYSLHRCCFCKYSRHNNNLKKYKRIMQKSQNFIKKELDLQKFIFRQRLQTTAILTMLQGRQLSIVDKMSELVLDESSDLSDRASSSSDDELNLIKKKASDKNIKRMIKSSDKVDKRLLNQYLIQ